MKISNATWPISLGYALMYILPLLALPLLSLADQYRYPTLWPEAWTLEHVQLLIDSRNGWAKTLAVSLLMSVSVSLAASSLALIITFDLSRQNVLSKWSRWAYLPYSFSPVVFAFCLQYALLKMGWCASYTGVWLAQLLLIFPYACLLFTIHWSTEMMHYHQIAHNLGASPFYTFVHIIIPLSRKMLVLVFFQSFLISWFDFGVVTVIGMGRVHTWMTVVYQYISESNIHLASIAGLIAIFPTLLLLFLQKHYSLIKPS